MTKCLQESRMREIRTSGLPRGATGLAKDSRYALLYCPFVVSIFLSISPRPVVLLAGFGEARETTTMQHASSDTFAGKLVDFPPG